MWQSGLQVMPIIEATGLSYNTINNTKTVTKAFEFTRRRVNLSFTHHVEVASVQNWVSTDQVRIIKYNGDRITLTTPPRLLNGREQTFELVWQRLK